MGFLDRLLGNEPRPQDRPSETRQIARPRSEDEQALERYRYMIRTAPPETIEQAHAEAFARLTPEQRQLILAELSRATPPEEQAAANAVSPNDPQAMGRLATRTEMRRPGFMERTLGGFGGGGGFGGSLLGSFAMGFVGSMVANSFFHSLGGFGGEPAAAADHDAGASNDAGGDADHTDAGDAGDGGDFDAGGFDGGDFGGGDF